MTCCLTIQIVNICFLLKCVVVVVVVCRDADGCTPFMAAVRGRSYNAGLTLFATAQCLATTQGTSPQIDRNILMSMLYPSDSHPDASPLHMLCCNDTCSFTWTGTEHINQDIFECRTCGLVGSLCCCTECARVCHRGHDCKYVLSFNKEKQITHLFMLAITTLLALIVQNMNYAILGINLYENQQTVWPRLFKSWIAQSTG